MKRLSILTLFLVVILLWACENRQSVSQEAQTLNQNMVNKKKNIITNIPKKKDFTWTKVVSSKSNWEKVVKIKKDPLFSSTKVYSGEKISKYTWSFSMKKPDLTEMTNWHSIISWYHVVWKKKILITKDILNGYVWQISKEDIEDYYWKDFKWNIKRSFCIDASYGTWHKNITLSEKQIQDIKNWKKLYVVVTWDYWWKWYGILTCNYNGCRNSGYKPLSFTKKEVEFFKKHGWLVLDPNWNTVDYSKEEANKPYSFGFLEEWNNFIRIIWGDSGNYERYPYNTLYISSDFLLHVFHKIFDNELKYKEETDLRQKVVNIAQTEFGKYKNKYLKTKDKNLKEIYGFLAAYEVIESSLLLPKEILLGKNTYNIKEPTDDEIKQKILAYLKSKISFFPSQTQNVIINEMNLILDSEKKKPDPLILYFFPNDNGFKELHIKQDFTQFRPRGYYTSNALLKTYFMWMKWLMREKFYFKSKNLAKASLILAKNLDKKELSKLKEIQDFVVKLIWGDDDVNIFDLRKFVQDNNLLTDQDVIIKFNKSLQNKLLNLKEQKIISTSYTTKTIWAKTEKQAHKDTVWFVFFWEKFTIDSWLIDKLTSWEAEWKKKPSITTALVIPYILNNNSVAGKLTKLWLRKNEKEGKINKSQANLYLWIAKFLINKVQYFNFSKNIYSQWLNTLNYVFVKITGNKPYWLRDGLYKLRKMLTYMWSYTELKHDTLLYAKQTYAELWWWSDDECLEVDPPALPVPKWYVEPNIDLLDQLIKLSDETNKIMKSGKFVAFEQKLKFLRKIALDEIKNKKISDDDFEKLRLINFINILKPNKAYGNILEKESRWAIIWDIANSWIFGSLYEALWRPALILMMIKDINGSRVVLWPVYTHYEFYKKWKRYTDEDWQADYDKKFKNNEKLKSLEYKFLEEEINK